MIPKLAVLYISLLSLISCQSQQSFDIKETHFLLGTIVEFTVYGDDETLALAAIKQASLAMQAVENEFATHGDIANSVKTFNQAKAGQKVLLSPSVDALLRQSIVVHKQTLGTFDPTLGYLNQSWGFSSLIQPIRPLTPQVIQDSLQFCGVRHIQPSGKYQWFKHVDALQLDFGAIAKGFSIDVGIKTLKKLGVKHAIINAGGDMRLLGSHGDKPWKIAVRHPRQDKPLGWLEVKEDVSIVTSGDYERFFMYEGKRYHHIIDPETGQPAQGSLSVTVVAPTATQADALSTAMFILGFEKGSSIIASMDDVEALWVDVNQQIHMTAGMKAVFHLNSSFDEEMSGLK